MTVRASALIISVLISALSAGIFHVDAQSFQRMESYAGLTSAKENNGVAIADYDLDGDLDVFIVAISRDIENDPITHSKLFRNNNDGTFTDVAANSGLINLFPASETAETSAALVGFKFGAFWGDYDNDGYPDLFMTNTNKIQLFHNKEGGEFVEVTEEAGFKKYNDCFNTDATWFDYNNDGYLDIYISDWGSRCEGNRLYKNNGNGTFTNVSDIFAGVENKQSYQSIPFDFNNDGWLDLYVANDQIPGPNDLFINNKGKGFTEKAASFGLANSQNDMGIAVGDYNNDGIFDLYVTTIGDNELFTGTPNNVYTDRGEVLEVNLAGWAWDVSMSDFDLDGDEDIFVTNGFSYPNTYSGKNVYFENRFANGEQKFVNSSEQTNLGETTISVGAGVFDFDKDGDLDIFLANNDGASFFYENKARDFTLESEGLNWFKIDLEGTQSNRDAIGTKVSITTENGKLHRFYTAKGFLSQNLVPVHFGLGKVTELMEVQITWPSGLVETYTNLPVNTTMYAVEGNGYEILNEESSKKIYGCMDSNSCNFNPYAVVNTGFCNALEAGLISGNRNSHKNSIETYSYSIRNGSELTWKVTGGKILEQNDSGYIKILWGEGNSGIITLTESNSNCISNEIEYKVTLEDKPSQDVNHSIARYWNEVLLNLIRQDYARPVVHARNLFHASIAAYDAWALYDKKATPYLIGNQVHGYVSVFGDFNPNEEVNIARKKTISYAMYTLLLHRFSNSPDPSRALEILNSAMASLGYDETFTSLDYTTGNAAALGNFIASEIINFGLEDGANEDNDYASLYYKPVNDPLNLLHPSGIENIDPNRWQPLTFQSFIDQSGHLIEGATPDFLGPEWGNVKPFSLTEEYLTKKSRNGNEYRIYHDPGKPPEINEEFYKWAFSLVSVWGSHLDPEDGVLWDISPAAMGNIDVTDFPTSLSGYKRFYNLIEGGDIGTGRSTNPITQSSYETQMVPRGDYTRVLAEFWADGPDSETPPGHWFTILNYVNDHNQLVKKFQGTGSIVDDLEWDVKSYFTLGGAMHDAAIAAWSAKGWYDYIRPISAIRYMASKGQSSNAELMSYHPEGILLKDGFIELVEDNDPLAGANNENVGKIKLYSWKGHEFINNPEVDKAGVGWILAEDWWPYQRPTFVTPPFAGYVSGHSTFSRAAAEVLTYITGSEYFPGGLGEFVAKKNEFLVFEEGPSVDVKLQWATYRDASDQCSLSRIWGGIHPPVDDIPGRLMGEKIGKKAFDYAVSFFEGIEKPVQKLSEGIRIFPNPVSSSSPQLFVSNTKLNDEFQLFDISGRSINIPAAIFDETAKISKLDLGYSLPSGVYILVINEQSRKVIVTDH